MRNVLLVLVIAAFTLNVESATVVYSQASEVVGHSKVTEKNDGTKDLWENGVEANLADYDYVALHQTRTPTTNAIFSGRSFTIGSRTKNRSVTLAVKLYDKEMMWGNYGLFLEYGSLQQWDTVAYPKVGRFAGTVTVTAPASDPFGIYPTADGTTDNYNLGVTGTFKSAVGTGAYVSHNDAYFKTKGNRNSIHFFLTGDTTEYHGELVARTNGFIEITGSSFAGKLISEGGSSITLSNKCTQVGSLTVKANGSVTVYLPYDKTNGTLTPFTVTDSFVREAGAPRVKVVVPAGSIGAEIGTAGLTLVSFTGAAAPSLDDFEFVGLEDFPEPLFDADPPYSDGQTIRVATHEYVMMKAGDAANYTSLSNLSSSGTSTPTNWTDNTLPHADAAYKITYALRTSPDGGNESHVDVFPGKKIVFYNGGSLLLKSGGFECLNAVFYCSSANAYGSPSPQRLRGRITIMPHAVGNVDYTTFSSQNKRVLAVEAALCGNGKLRFSANAKDTPFLLYGDNTDFSGRFHVIGTSANVCSCVSVTNANALGVGGWQGVLDGEAICVYTYGKLMVNESLSYFDSQRCFYLYDHARIGVAEGKTFEIRSRIKMGEDGFVKEDPGTLALGNYFLGFGSNNSGTPDDGVNNVISVDAGALMVTDVNAVNGARIVLSAGTQIVVGKDLGEKGFLNVKTGVPFATTAEDGLIRFVVETKDGALPSKFTVPLCTVSETAANALREKIVVAKPASGYWVEPIKAETNVDGSVTLSVTCCRTGLAVIFK